MVPGITRASAFGLLSIPRVLGGSGFSTLGVGSRRLFGVAVDLFLGEAEIIEVLLHALSAAFGEGGSGGQAQQASKHQG